MFLPHGYEGQGPEHSSARLERFLQLCAEHNMQVCVPSTPAQMFHMIRRQMLRSFRKPLIVMTPKSLLRHKFSVSPLSALSNGKFHLIIPDDTADPDQVTRVIFCSGKVYYDLVEGRQVHNVSNAAIVRIEQLYPLSVDELLDSLASLPEGREVVWVQEEPTNMGAWPYFKLSFADALTQRFRLHRVSRVESASPSTGSMAAHKLEQAELIEEAFSGLAD